MKTITLIAICAVIAGLCLVEESEAWRGGFGGRGFGGRGFGRWGWGWGGFGMPWWGWGGYPGIGWGRGWIGKRDVPATPSTICALNAPKTNDADHNNVTLHCKSPAKEFTCNGLSNLNPAWNIKLNHLALIPVDHTAPVADWDVKVLATDAETHALKNFTTVVENHELTISMVANESIMVPGYLFQDQACWTDFINLVKDTKFDDFEFDLNDE